MTKKLRTDELRRIAIGVFVAVVIADDALAVLVGHHVVGIDRDLAAAAGSVDNIGRNSIPVVNPRNFWMILIPAATEVRKCGADDRIALINIIRPYADL